MASLALAFDILAKDKTGHAFGTAGRNADGLASKLSNVGKVASLAIGGAAITAVAGLGAALVGGVKDAVSYQTLQKKTEAVIKSTGNAAKISVKGVQGLAASLEHVSGVDEELIINGQNVLATFTKVRNETGKGNKIFDRATEAALNLSVAMGTDMQSASVLLGKALNDPVGAIGKLGKAGVQFSDDQKFMIRAFTETGDVLSAQKIILGELETQFGGLAEAAGSGLQGDLDRLKDSFSDMFREIGESILPPLTDAANWLAERLPPLVETIKGFVHDGLEALSGWWEQHGGTVIDGVKGLATTLKDDLGPPLTAVGGFLRDVVVPKLGEFGTWIVDNEENMETLKVAIYGIAAAWTAYAIAAAIANAVNPFTAITVAILGMLGALQWFTQTFKPQINDALQYIVDHGGEAFLHLLQAIADSIETIIGNLKDAIGWVKRLIEAADRIPDIGIPGAPKLPFDVPIVPWFADGGVMPGPRGVHSLAMVAGGETILPTHKFGFDAVGEDQLLELRRQNALLASIDDAVRTTPGVRGWRATAAVMG